MRPDLSRRHRHASVQRAPARVAVGKYLCSDRDLYRVEKVFRRRVLLEDCRSGVLLDVEPSDLRRLRRVEPRQ
jgi:hypothetical protein